MEGEQPPTRNCFVMPSKVAPMLAAAKSSAKPCGIGPQSGNNAVVISRKCADFGPKTRPVVRQRWLILMRCLRKLDKSWRSFARREGSCRRQENLFRNWQGAAAGCRTIFLAVPVTRPTFLQVIRVLMNGILKFSVQPAC